MSDTYLNGKQINVMGSWRDEHYCSEVDLIGVEGGLIGGTTSR